MKKQILIAVFLFSLSQLTLADESIKLALVSNHQEIGTVTLSDIFGGTLVTPNLQSLPKGSHGFHLHTNASCGDNAQAAGGHFDPKNTGKHLGPYDTSGHSGDLPVLLVDEKGLATLPIFVPRLKVKDFSGHAIMIHAGSDNYADSPEKLGGGGARIACGVIMGDSNDA